MPVVFRERGFRFHFYSGEGNPREPVHVARPGGDAKLWLYPEVRVPITGGSRPESCARSKISSRNGDRTLKMHGTPFSPEATSVEFDEDSMWVALEDGRTIDVPLAWYPRLLKGSPEARPAVFLSPTGLHWDELDEDISIASLLAGKLETPAPASARAA